MGHCFRASSPAKEEVGRIFAGLLARARAQLEHVEEEPAERIHECRKLLKRARALLAMVAPGLPKEVYERERRACRDAARRLSGARDATVMEEVFEAEVCKGNLEGEFVERARQVLRSARATKTRMLDPSELGETRAILAEVEARIPEWVVELGEWEQVLDGCEATYRDARNRMRRAAARGDAELFHRWRKFSKYHLYQMGWMTPVWPKRLEVRIRRLERLGERLGLAHDLEVLRSALRAEAALDEALDRQLTRRRHRLETKALRKGQKLFARSPAKFRASLETRLQAL